MAAAGSVIGGLLGSVVSKVWWTRLFCPERQWKHLKQEADLLGGKKDDVEKQWKVQLVDEKLLVEKKEEVEVWMRNVDEVKQEVKDLQLLIEKRRQSRPFCFCCCCCCNYTSLGDKISNILKRIVQLKLDHDKFKNKFVQPYHHRTILENLKREIARLNAKRVDLEKRIEYELLQNHVKQSEEATLWLNNVDDLNARNKSQETAKDERKLRELLSDVINCRDEKPDCLVVPDIDLIEILKDLKGKRAKLSDESHRLENKVQTETLMNSSMKMSKETNEWKKTSKELLKTVHSFLLDVQIDNQEIQHTEFNVVSSTQEIQHSGRSGSSSSQPIQDNAVKWTHKINELLVQRERIGENIFISTPLPESIFSYSSKLLVGIEDNISKVHILLKDDNVDIIGIHGLGGIGKTTLLKEIQNMYRKKLLEGFDLCIFVTVSKTSNILKIQEDIGVCLGYMRDAEKSINGKKLKDDKEDRAKQLQNALSRRKFLLMLDDVWSELKLEELGIPLLDINKPRKILLTTRDETVCIDMDVADHARVKLNLLDNKKSDQLFRQAVGNDSVFDSKEITSLAKEIVGKCGGLPLLLQTMGKAMANKREEASWKHATHNLKSFPAEIRNMEKHILVSLKYSFDNLKNDNSRSCLLFCCLFDEDENIHIPRLVDYWIGEGLLDDKIGLWYESNNVLPMLRWAGESLIEDLLSSSLLERGEEKHVKLHDAVREMGLWIANDDSSGGSNLNQKFLPLVGEAYGEVTIDAKYWKNFKRISIREDQMKTYPVDSETDKSQWLTLLVGKTWDYDLTYGNQYFPYLMEYVLISSTTLLVLDLSGAVLGDFPRNFTMIALRYLNLEGTEIRQLALGAFPNLKQLNLSNTKKLTSILKPDTKVKVSLQSLKLYGSEYNVLSGDLMEDELGLTDLLRMLQLEELTLSIEDVGKSSDPELVDLFVKSELIRKSLRRIKFAYVKALTIARLSTALESMKKLEHVDIENYPSPGNEEITLVDNVKRECLESISVSMFGGFSIARRHDLDSFPRLQKLSIKNCFMVSYNVQWLDCVPSLEELELNYCKELVEILTTEESEGGNTIASFPFPHLSRLCLDDLPILTYISSRLLQNVEFLVVVNCPMLKKLPPVSPTTKIRCSWSWWECLEFDDDSEVKSNMKTSGKVTFYDHEDDDQI